MWCFNASTRLTQVQGDVLTQVQGDVLTQVQGDVLTQVQGDVLTQVQGDALTQVQGDVLPMQKYFVKVQSFLIKFNLWSNTITTKLENNRFWIVLDAANDCIIKYAGGLRVSPHRQFLQHISTLSSSLQRLYFMQQFTHYFLHFTK